MTFEELTYNAAQDTQFAEELRQDPSAIMERYGLQANHEELRALLDVLQNIPGNEEKTYSNMEIDWFATGVASSPE